MKISRIYIALVFFNILVFLSVVVSGVEEGAWIIAGALLLTAAVLIFQRRYVFRKLPVISSSEFLRGIENWQDLSAEKIEHERAKIAKFFGIPSNRLRAEDKLVGLAEMGGAGELELMVIDNLCEYYNQELISLGSEIRIHPTMNVSDVISKYCLEVCRKKK